MNAVLDEIALVAVTGLADYIDDRHKEKEQFSHDDDEKLTSSPVTNYEEHSFQVEFSYTNDLKRKKRVIDEIPTPTTEQPRKKFSRKMCVFYGIKFIE